MIVDDEADLAEIIASTLQADGWQTAVAHTGGGALGLAERFDPDVVVLDVMLPDLDGRQVLRRLRSTNPDVGVLFLTARDAVADRVEGITAGADDYVTKPFSLQEVLARLRGLVRRAGLTQGSARQIIRVGDLSLDEDSHEVTRGGTVVSVTATEFELLRFLMHHPHRVLSKAQILDRVWNYDFGGRAHVVELYISSLRKKIDQGREPMIHTVRGAGYLIKPAQ